MLLPEPLQLRIQPLLHHVVADEPRKRCTGGMQPRLQQHGPGPGGLPLLGEGEGREQDRRLACAIPLAIALEQNERALGLPPCQGGQRRQEQQFWAGRPGAQGLLGDVARLRGPRAQSLAQAVDPKLPSPITGFGAPGFGGHVVRQRIEVGQDILPGGITRRRVSVAHGIASTLALLPGPVL